MSPPLCGEELQVQLYPTPPRGVPIHGAAHAGPEGLGCIRRYLGRRWKFNRTRHPHGASLSPKRPKHDRRDSGVCAAVWGGAGSSMIPDPPRGVPIHGAPRAQPG